MTLEQHESAVLDAALLLAAMHDPAVVVRGRSQNQQRAYRWLVRAAMEYGQAIKEANGG